MAYCRKCGAEIYDEAVVCPHCGVAQNTVQTSPSQQVPQTDGGVGVLVGILCPLIGLIASVIYSSNGNHKAAKNTAVASIFAFIFYVIIIMLMNMGAF